MSLVGLLRSPVTMHLKKVAGLICVACGPWSIHLFVKSRFHWVWGKQETWFDGPLLMYGLGPLFLISGVHPDAWCYFCDDDRCKDRARHGWF